jgi:hypothetical protein
MRVWSMGAAVAARTVGVAGAPPVGASLGIVTLGRVGEWIVRLAGGEEGAVGRE